LPHLVEYQSKMFTFLSLSSPHLGYMYSSGLIDAGSKNFSLNNLMIKKKRRNVDSEEMEKMLKPSTIIND